MIISFHLIPLHAGRKADWPYLQFLNTFIDDLFAFTIKMPTLHRLATLRDDVIFFVYLYQSWKYKVDYSRVNEFGQGGDDEDDAKEKPSKNEAPKATATLEAKPEAKSSGADSSGAGAEDVRKR